MIQPPEALAPVSLAVAASRPKRWNYPTQFALACLAIALPQAGAADFTPAPQHFRQEIAQRFTEPAQLAGPVQLLDCAAGAPVRAFAGGQWFIQQGDHFAVNDGLRQTDERKFVFADRDGKPVAIDLPWKDARQILRTATMTWVISEHQCLQVQPGGQAASLDWPTASTLCQIAVSPDGTLYAASSGGLRVLKGKNWQPVEVLDAGGRAWAVRDVLGTAFDTKGQLWFATKAGVGCQTPEGWRFYEGKDGLPWNDFTGVAAGPAGEVWFATHLGAIRFENNQWHYRQGLGWLPNDDLVQEAVDAQGNAWFATRAGFGTIQRRPMTLAEKAELYEQEIERYIKRTPFGYVAEAPLSKAADKSTAHPQDSDNDGLWTSMYGAGECFAYGATHDAKAKERAKKAFEALRFLQKVTQGCTPEPPKGYLARTIRPIDWPDPNVGRIEGDRANQQRDPLWKAYEPRWPKSADGKWYWKSDTSSDELDGHYFFYPLYFDLCADTDAERERVREVVRDLTDHFLSHQFNLVDIDGTSTRWGVYSPQSLNHDFRRIGERGLNSLSMLSYLAVAAHVTGDAKYEAASQELINRESYALNAVFAKVQQGPGSGNQSDDEMAFMSYYSLLRYSKDAQLKNMILLSFYRYWVNEVQEMNPFFNFAYAVHALNGSVRNIWGMVDVKPWAGWHADAMTTLYGFPLDRLAWNHKNSHRLDLIRLTHIHAEDLESAYERHPRGYRVNGKVVPVENRFFNHWNTDPWSLDYHGNGSELGAGTVFLLPYYLGIYHGFIEKPAGS